MEQEVKSPFSLLSEPISPSSLLFEPISPSSLNVNSSFSPSSPLSPPISPSSQLCLGHFFLLPILFLPSLQKLKAVGISGNLLSWMGSYLINRNQFVQVNEEKSNTSSIKFGVPQGSILGPKLFSLYVNDFPEFVTSGELYMFADDTTIFTVGNNIDIIIKAMQVILDQVLSWCGANRLIAHETKSEALLLSKQRFIGPLLALKYGEKFII